MNRRRFLMALFALLSTAAGALQPDQVLITYDLKMGDREISGASHEVEWSFMPIDQNRAQMRLRVPVESFQSGHGDFDAALRKAVDAKRHPTLEIEGIAREGRLDGTVEIAGTSRPIAVRLHLERAGGNLIAMASVTIDLRDYGVVLDGADPHMSIDALIRVPVNPDAVLAGGYTRPSSQ
jgi:polyisoprenoid-binding protein YceI